MVPLLRLGDTKRAADVSVALIMEHAETDVLDLYVDNIVSVYWATGHADDIPDLAQRVIGPGSREIVRDLIENAMAARQPVRDAVTRITRAGRSKTEIVNDLDVYMRTLVYDGRLDEAADLLGQAIEHGWVASVHEGVDFIRWWRQTILQALLRADRLSDALSVIGLLDLADREALQDNLGWLIQVLADRNDSASLSVLEERAVLDSSDQVALLCATGRLDEAIAVANAAEGRSFGQWVQVAHDLVMASRMVDLENLISARSTDDPNRLLLLCGAIRGLHATGRHLRGAVEEALATVHIPDLMDGSPFDCYHLLFLPSRLLGALIAIGARADALTLVQATDRHIAETPHQPPLGLHQIACQLVELAGQATVAGDTGIAREALALALRDGDCDEDQGPGLWSLPDVDIEVFNTAVDTWLESGPSFRGT